MERIDEYCEMIARLYNEHHKDGFIQGYHVDRDYGRKFVKISIANRVHTFIDFATGDILKAATYKAPAKNGVRGNIWADDLGESCVDYFGTRYLK